MTVGGREPGAGAPLRRTTREVLGSVKIFHPLPPAEIARLSEMMVRREIERGAFIVSKDAPADAFYVIESGEVKVNLYGESGREITLCTLSDGQFFGELSLLDGGPRSANVIATRDSILFVLHRRDFLAYLDQHPAFAVSLLEELARRLRNADQVIGSLALLDVFGRVARFIIELGERQGRREAGLVVIDERPTQAEIASMLGTARETVSRALSAFVQQGYIDMDGRRIVIRDLPKYEV